MPFHTVKSGDKWNVENADTGEVKNAEPYDNEADAQAYSNALNAHSEDVGKFDNFIPLAKVDERKRQVWGVASDMTADNTNEVMDYDKSKPHFLAWSQSFTKASGGASKGNLRAMHQAIAAGKVIHFEARDARKDFYIGAEVVDDNEWKKVLKGVYTGFSIGGRYGETWTDISGLKHYVAIPSEISLVDKPCNPNATFEFVRADGSSEMRKMDEFINQESNMAKVFPPKKEPTPAEAAAAKAAEAAQAADQAAKAPADAVPAIGANETQPAPDKGENKANPFGGDKPADGKAPSGKEAPQPPAESETPPAKSDALSIIAAALRDGTMSESVAAQLKAAIGLEEQGETNNPDPSGIGNPEAGMSGTPAGPDPMELRQLVLSLLEELGLVERTENGAMKVEPSGVLQKGDVDSELQKRDDSLAKMIDDGDRALAKDIAVVTISLETLEKRINDVAGQGPVIREIGTNFSPSNLQRADQLRKAISVTNNPADRQALENELATLEIKSVQNSNRG